MLRSLEKENIHHALYVRSDTTEAGEEFSDDGYIEMLIALLKLGSGKLLIFLYIQRFQIHQRHALIERTHRGCEHLCHQVAVRAREDEMGIGASLNIGAEQCLYTVVGIVCDLLKLVYSYKTWLISLVEIREYLIKRNLGIYNVSDTYSPNWSPIDIERYFRTERR